MTAQDIVRACIAHEINAYRRKGDTRPNMIFRTETLFKGVLMIDLDLDDDLFQTFELYTDSGARWAILGEPPIAHMYISPEPMLDKCIEMARQRDAARRLSGKP